MAKCIKNRNVFGPSGEIGYIVKTPGHGKIAANKIEERKMQAREDERNQEERERMRNELYMKDFWVSSDKHCINSRIERLVEMGMKSYEADLEHKKNKLKVMILDDESNLTREYVDKAQKSANVQFESKVKQAEEIQSKQADAQKSFVRDAYERIFQESCDELRTKTARERRMGLNKMHEIQMCERVRMEEQAKEEEKLWAAMGNQEDEMRLQRLAVEASRNKKQLNEYVMSLSEQMNIINQQRVNENCVEKIEELSRREYQVMKEKELELREAEALQKKEAYAIELRGQLEANRLLKRKIQEEETHFDKIMIDEDRKAAEREKLAVVDNRAQLKCELLCFGESLKQFKKSLAEHEKDMEFISEQYKNQHEQEQLAVKRKVAQARQDLLKSCIEVRREQVAHRKTREFDMKQLDRKEAELTRFRENQSKALDSAKRDRELQDCKRNRDVIRECDKYDVVRRERERLEVEEFNIERNRRFEEIDRKTKELLSRPVLTTGTALHPFLNPLLSAGDLASNEHR